MCSSHDSFDAASPLRRTVYFREGVPHYTPVRLYEYDLDRDATRELAIESVIRVLDISEDGRTLLVDTFGGLVLYDVVADSSTPVKGLGKINDAGLLNASDG
ncbi:hypothetical protein [Hyalangium minutum]|uniref:Uncharacterized protein n=1 Tax=Hyalangium minutum TaxID=394096 RepID=A0A085W9M9_9BACT|nr:hypothetical protein [Hyalangium minutum]KFE64392.1 hypothetical protein DB31_2186 [Hyalangium minutum]